MIMWRIYTYFGSEFPIGMSKEIPDGVRPPQYVSSKGDGKSFLPYAGEFERVYIDEEKHTVTYEKITPFLGGK